MAYLPDHGHISCNLCYGDAPVHFDRTRRQERDWRITANPMACGSTNAEVVVLGFSKGPTQARGDLASLRPEDVAFKGGRTSVGKILEHVGLIVRKPGETHEAVMERLIADRSGRFHFGSLVKCTVERQEPNGAWKGAGGGMLDKFVAQPFGRQVINSCIRRYLGDLPVATKLVVLFGLGTGMGYVDAALQAFQEARPGAWQRLNAVSYSDGKIIVVHVEHFKSQGALIPQWLGQKAHRRGELGLLARQSVTMAVAVKRA